MVVFDVEMVAEMVVNDGEMVSKENTSVTRNNDMNQHYSSWWLKNYVCQSTIPNIGEHANNIYNHQLVNDN